MYINIKLNHLAVHQTLMQHYKSTVLQLKNMVISTFCPNNYNTRFLYAE